MALIVDVVVAAGDTFVEEDILALHHHIAVEAFLDIPDAAAGKVANFPAYYEVVGCGSWGQDYSELDSICCCYRRRLR